MLTAVLADLALLLPSEAAELNTVFSPLFTYQPPQTSVRGSALPRDGAAGLVA